MEKNKVKSLLPTLVIPFGMAVQLYRTKIIEKAIRAGLSISAVAEMESKAGVVIDLRLVQWLREAMDETPIKESHIPYADELTTRRPNPIREHWEKYGDQDVNRPGTDVDLEQLFNSQTSDEATISRQKLLLTKHLKINTEIQ